jgi:hypothetical protein
MDVETSDAIETLRGDMTSLESKIEGVRASLESKIEQLDSKIDRKTAEAMTHARVLNEAVRDDVRLVAEAMAVLTVKVDALRDAR